MPRYAENRKQRQEYVFIGPNLSSLGGTLQSHGTLGVQQYWMLRRGSVTGFSGSLNAALSTGTLTFQPTIDGSLAPTFDTAILHVNQQAAVQTKDAEGSNLIFTAGQALGISYTASDSLTPVTVDGIFIVEVLLDDIE